ncbi:hypothetical protein [Streptomyces sp. WG-D5]
MTGYTIEPEVLRAAAKRVRGAVNSVDRLHLDKLGDGEIDFGHGDAAKAFTELITTWHHALTKVLKDEGEETAGKLSDSAGEYERGENDTVCRLEASAQGSR